MLHIEDALGSKLCALAGRAAERDYIDTAAALARGYDPGQLIAFARRLDPGLNGQEFADAGRRLDQLSDQRWTDLGFSPGQVTQMREQFAAWPRDAGQADPEQPASGPRERPYGQEQMFRAAGRGSDQQEPGPAEGLERHQEERDAEADRDDPEIEP